MRCKCLKKVCECIRGRLHLRRGPRSPQQFYGTQKPPVNARWEPLITFRSVPAVIRGGAAAGLSFDQVVAYLRRRTYPYITVLLEDSGGRIVRGQAHEVDDRGILRIRNIRGTGTVALVMRVDDDQLVAEIAEETAKKS